MTVIATDSGAGGPGLLGANWGFLTANSNDTSMVRSPSADFSIQGASIDVGARWVGAGTFVDDHYSEIIIASGTGTGSDYAAVLGRAQGTAGTFKAYQITTDRTSGAGHTVFQRWRNGALDPDLAPIATTFAFGDRMQVRVSGSGATVTVQLYKNGVLIDAYLDTDGNRITTGGSPGWGGFTSLTVVHMSTWEGGNIDASGNTAAVAWLRA